MCSMWKEVWIGRVKPGHGAARASTVRQPPELCTMTAVYSMITPEADYCRKWIPRVFLAHHRADISAAVVLADATTILLVAPAM